VIKQSACSQAGGGHACESRRMEEVSRGIGAAIVRRLIQKKMGVAFTYSNASEKAVALATEIQSGGGRALAIKADSDAQCVIYGH
jgi:hypothetical protein